MTDHDSVIEVTENLKSLQVDVLQLPLYEVLEHAHKFVVNAKEYLDNKQYFITATNRETIDSYFYRIYEVLADGYRLPNNRICTLLTGLKQCGKTLLMKLTCEYLNKYCNTAAIYLECRSNFDISIVPLKLCCPVYAA